MLFISARRQCVFSCAGLVLLLSLFSCAAFADPPADIFPIKTVYFGVNLGGGSTEWKYLVDTSDSSQTGNTPVAVSEGGPSWGAVFGYAMSKNFAIELQYMQFANSAIDMGSGSQYTDQNGNPVTNIGSRTDAYSLSGKFLAQIGHTRLRAFAAIGVGTVERTDPLVNYEFNVDTGVSNYTGKNRTISCVTPYLSSGLVYSFNRHWMLESGFQYYTGFGKSQVYPVSGFIPFAWDGYARLAYQL
jgi:hypothetical protein